MVEDQMFPISVLETDEMGRMYIRPTRSQTDEVATYLEGVKGLQSFLRSKELESYVTGFFLSNH